ncbi:hypothetical protein MMC21_007209 [Puttea exsequens]|nr:hypothetical protein [Puttea exsequens]
MAPNRIKKSRNSTDNTRVHALVLNSPARTPTQSPQRKAMRITETQKQALIDNLQLEITERARKLRAQYALQAQSLRTRIELRINRIPTSLRKANMGELLEKYTEIAKAKSVPEKSTFPNASSITAVTIAEDAEPPAMPKTKGAKRKSNEITPDQENPIPNPKKRTKATTTARAPPSRQYTNPTTVLSPKSANSRTLPHSPTKQIHFGSPQRSYISHPASPLKPLATNSPTKNAAAAATAMLAGMLSGAEKRKPGRPKAARNVSNPKEPKAGTGSGKRILEEAKEPEDVRKVSNTSNISAASTGTTVVTKPKVLKKNVGKSAVGKKVVGGVGLGMEAPATGRRVLRKR